MRIEAEGSVGRVLPYSRHKMTLTWIWGWSIGDGETGPVGKMGIRQDLK